MKHEFTSRPGCAQLRSLLAISRELLQLDEVPDVLRLVGRAISDVPGAGTALLVVRAECEYAIGVDRSGIPRPAAHDHPFYGLAAEVFAGVREGAGDALDRQMTVLGVPASAPFAALAVHWDRDMVARERIERKQLLRAILELAVAAMGKMEARNALENLVLTQYQQLAESAQGHAAELAGRDLADRNVRALSLTDVLTGLNNRRGFFVHAEQALKVARRRSAHSAVIFADVVGHETVNNELGHEAGESLVRDVAAVFRESFRGTDVVARLGGDEFVSYTLDDADPGVILSRLQDNIDAFNLMQERRYRVGVSAGIVRCDPKADQDLGQYLLQADQQRYVHKRQRLH